MYLIQKSYLSSDFLLELLTFNVVGKIVQNSRWPPRWLPIPNFCQFEVKNFSYKSGVLGSKHLFAGQKRHFFVGRDRPTDQFQKGWPVIRPFRCPPYWIFQDGHQAKQRFRIMVHNFGLTERI